MASLRNCRGKMYESFLEYGAPLPTTAINYCMMCANELGTDKPIHWIFRDLAQEDDDRVCLAKLVFLAFDTCGPIPKRHCVFDVKEILQMVS